MTIDLDAMSPISEEQLADLEATVARRHGAAYGITDAGLVVTLTGMGGDKDSATHDAVAALRTALDVAGLPWTLAQVSTQPYAD